MGMCGLFYRESFIAGFPSVGKSTLLTNLAGVYSEVAEYEFTTLTTVPGVIRYKGAKIQVCTVGLDLRHLGCPGSRPPDVPRGHTRS